MARALSARNSISSPICGFFSVTSRAIRSCRAAWGWMPCGSWWRALGSGEVKFTGQILPSARLVSYTIDVKRVIERQLIMGIADGKVSVDGKDIYYASDLRVGLFQSTEGF